MTLIPRLSRCNLSLISRIILVLLVLSCLSFRHSGRRNYMGTPEVVSGDCVTIDYDAAWGVCYTTAWEAYETAWS